MKDVAPQILSIQIAVHVEFRKDSAYPPISRSLTKQKVQSGYFQLSGNKKIRQHVFPSQGSGYFMVKKVLLITTKLDLSREFILM